MAPSCWNSVRGRSTATCSVLFLLSLAAWSVKAAGNIDTLEPIVRRSPARPPQLNSVGSLGDWFGYSAALHQLVEPRSFEEALENTRIVVGAPRGTFPGGFSLDSSTPENETGLVYDCPILAGPCSRLGNGQGDDVKLFDPQPNQRVALMLGGPINMVESKSGQLMGATVVSNGDFLVACAPRFSIAIDKETSTSQRLNLDTRSPIGRCYISPRNLTGFIEMRPCVPMTATQASICLAGFSAVFNTLGNDQVSVVLGTPGENEYAGVGILYNVNGSAAIRDESVSFDTVVESYTYQSYAMATGNITGSMNLDYIMSAPRADGSIFKGRVLIRPANNIGMATADEIRGTQNGEYFGWSVGAADLNNDGYDELLVGAPLYSTPDVQEYGRVYVFKNNRGSLSTSDPIILSDDEAPNARFGTSITRIGDVNDDGFEDFAVGAPYYLENAGSGSTGKVFIYYGSENFVTNSVGQEISADDVARVAGLSELKSFGFSLSSGVDVDNNEFQDLLIGAYDSGTAVLLRALSVARIVITGSTNLTDDTLPINLTASDSPTFNLKICASFSGRGLTGPLVTNLNVRETGSNSRLLFDGVVEENKDFTFMTTNMDTCQDVIVTIQDKNRLYSAGATVENFTIAFTLTQDPRVTPAGFNGSSATLSDLRETPILLISGNTSITVIPQVTCRDLVCQPDLSVIIINYTYLSNVTSTVYPNVVAGSTGVDTITTNLRIENENLDAATGARMQISMPSQFGFFEGSTNTGVRVTCTPANGMYDCNLPNLILGETTIEVSLNWTRLNTQPILGNETDVTSNVNVMVDADTGPSNNAASIIVQFSAVADLTITSVRLTGPTTYDDQAPPPIVNFGQLGPRVSLEVRLTNLGPSILRRIGGGVATVRIYSPVRDSATGENYYLYPGSLETGAVGNSIVNCSMENINPERFESPPPTTRRKRSTVSKRQVDPTPSPQDSEIPANSVKKECNDPATRTASCEVIVCTIRNWNPNQDFSITISHYLDRRFFRSQSQPFVFTAYAEVNLASTFTTDNNLTNNNAASNRYSILREQDEGDDFILTIIVPIVAVIGAIILIAALFCLLYFVGFFRRKKFGEEAEGDFEVREVPPEAVNGDKPGSLPNDDEVVPRDTTPNKEDPTSHNDIGDASDLHDGEVATADNDPDETSL